MLEYLRLMDYIGSLYKKLKTRLGVNLYVIGILFVVSFLSLSWFGGATAMGGGDHYRSIDFYRYAIKQNSAWLGYDNTGSPNFALEFHLPFSLFFVPLGLLGVSAGFAQRVWMFMSLFIPGLFMYLFLDEFFGEKFDWKIKVVPALFYLVNPILMRFPIGYSLTKYPVYLSLPIISFLILKVFNTSSTKNTYLYLFLLSLSSLLVPASVKNIAELAPCVIIFGSLLIYKIIESGEYVKNLLKILFVVLSAFLYNFWWIFSSFYSQYLAKDAFVDTVSNYVGFETKIFDALRLFGFWGMRSSHKDVPYYSYGEYYYTKTGVLLTFVPVIIVFLPLLLVAIPKIRASLERKELVKYLLFILLTLTGIFLVKGINGPYGDWFQNSLDNIPLFRMFREPYSKFSYTTLFSYVVALCYSFYLITKKIPKYSSKIGLLLLGGFALLMPFISFPMFTGEILPDETYGQRKQLLATVPDYWYELEEYSKNNELKGRVLTLPKSYYYKKSFIWDKGYVGYPYELFLDANYINFKTSGNTDTAGGMIKGVYDAIEYYNTTQDPRYLTSFLNISRLLNINYLLQMNDLDVQNLYQEDSWDPDGMYDFYSALGDYIDSVNTFGWLSEDYLMSIPHVRGGENIHRGESDATTETYLRDLSNKPGLELFKLKDGFFSEMLYVPDKVYKFPGPTDIATFLFTEPVFDQNFAFYLDDVDIAQTLGKATLGYDKVTESKYKITISDIEGDKLPIVFQSSHDMGWRIARRCNWLYCSDYIDSENIKVNMYANSWILDTSELAETPVLYLVHDSSFRLKLGVIVSISSLLLIPLVIFKLVNRRKYNG